MPEQTAYADTNHPLPEIGEELDARHAFLLEPRYVGPVDGKDISLIRKLAEVTAAIGPVSRSGFNSDRGYAYATETDLFRVVRGPLSALNVVLLAAEVDRSRHTLRRVKSGTGEVIETPLVDVVVRFELMDGDSGERLSFHSIGTRADYDGSGADGALTSAVRKAISKQFLIPLDDDAATPTGTPRSTGRSAGAPPAAASGSGFIVKIGKEKGRPLTAQADAQLAWLLGLECRDEKWRKQHDRDHAAYREEAARRGWQEIDGVWQKPKPAAAETPAPAPAPAEATPAPTNLIADAQIAAHDPEPTTGDPEPCDTCRGTGKYADDPCWVCGGQGVQ